MARHKQQTDMNAASASVPSGTPVWITGDLIETTIRVWQPFYNEPISAEVAVEMLINVGQLVDSLRPKGSI